VGEGKQDLQGYHRRSIRLKGYDYASPGAYFITICAVDRKCVFGEIVADAMRSNAFGDIVATCWNEIPAHFPNVRLDAFVLMPNHVHGILIIEDAPDCRGTTCRAPTGAGTDRGGSQGAGSGRAPTDAGGDRGGSQGAGAKAGGVGVDTLGSAAQRFGVPSAQSLPTVLRSFKAAVTKRVRELAGRPDLEIWQRNYFEHVIRNEDSPNEIRRYIQENPLRWALDRENPANIRGNRVRR
jgi:REP element-mobilizing transposase RayT